MPSHKILVVDDDRHLTVIIQLLLERDGYNVAISTDGLDAYATYLQHRSELIITDIQMPGMSGVELVQRIRASNPEIKTIYMSGHSALLRWAAQKEEQAKHRVVMLEKPFARADLRELVASCLPDDGRT